MQVTVDVPALSQLDLNTLTAAGMLPALSSGKIQNALSALDVNSDANDTSAVPQLTRVGVAKPSICGDGVCGPGETPVVGEMNTGTTCSEDCPFSFGKCPSPGTSEAGDPTKVRCLMSRASFSKSNITFFLILCTRKYF